jgi:hypothetical protein
MKPLGVLLLPILAAAAAPPLLPPVDTCAGDASLRAFRADLSQAVARKDKDRLLALVADDVLVDFGGGSGRADFARTWDLDRPETSLLWSELGEALRLGCVRDGAAAASPSLFRQLSDEADAFDKVVVTGANVRLMAAPGPDGQVVANLPLWAVLKVRDWDGSGDWTPVTLADGRQGYVPSTSVRSPIDRRAIFGKRTGGWRMTGFVVGD